MGMRLKLFSAPLTNQNKYQYCKVHWKIQDGKHKHLTSWKPKLGQMLRCFAISLTICSAHHCIVRLHAVHQSVSMHFTMACARRALHAPCLNVMVSVVFVFGFSLCNITSASNESGIQTGVNCTDDFQISYDDSRYYPSCNVTDYGVLKCYIECPMSCNCYLADFGITIFNCTATVSSQQVYYPPTLGYLSWADSEISSIEQGSFAGFAETLRALNLNKNKLRNIRPRQFQTLNSLLSLEIQNNYLNDIDVDAFEGLSELELLDLYNNDLTVLRNGVFKYLTQLVALYLDYNKLTMVKEGLFDSLFLLHDLRLDNNYIMGIQRNVFKDIANLSKIKLNNNQLSHLDVNTFKALNGLTSLHLGDNLLQELHHELFQTLNFLKLLELRNNSLSKLHPRTFNNLSNLYFLDLSYNQIDILHPKLFQNTRKLKILQLAFMGLQSLEEETFHQMQGLEYLSLLGNSLTVLGSFLFKECSYLETLDLEKNDLQWIESDTFYGINNQAKLFVDSPGSCCFADKFVGKCHAKNGKSPFLTCKRLLPYSLLRIGTWVVSVLAVAANVVVHIVGWIDKRKINKVQFLLIRNLSISDFFMGIYLIILLSVDLYYTEYFPLHSNVWRNSGLCKIAGFLSVLSSEASVFFITLISIDRFIRVKYPQIGRQLGVKIAYLLIASMWLIAMGLSTISVALASGKNSDMYAASEVCVGLPLSRYYHYNYNETFVDLPFGRKAQVTLTEQSGKRIAMYFSLYIFTVLNLVCFIVVGYCYIAVFIFVRQSSKRSGHRSISNNEIRMAKKLFLIVFTDFCCWVPIGFLSILVQTGAVEVHPVAYAWIATFILPINSSINPFLYTLGDVMVEKVNCCKLKADSSDMCLPPIKSKISRLDSSKMEDGDAK